MCGIAGFFHYRNENCTSAVALQKMTRSMAHRGPDDSGCAIFDRSSNKYVFFGDQDKEGGAAFGHVGLGHRRLSILDLSESGRQPMSAADDNVWLLLNGEIYNFLELREELETYGHVFTTQTDTEVVLASYLEWGTDCFNRFNGMWGLALYDKRSEKLILSRDRFGKKPLYYYCDDKLLVFGSEIKALFQHPLVPKEMNVAKVADYAGRHYRYVDIDDDSYFRNIHQVPKSSFMVFKTSGLHSVEHYWQLIVPDSCRIISDVDAVEEFRYLLRDSVRLRLRSDVPVGCMLSGGLDSGSITSLAAQEYDNMHTFSGITGEGDYDESEYIEEVVRHAGTQHTYNHIDYTNLFSVLKEMLQFHDEPVCTVTWLCIYILCKQVAQNNIPVILTGHGGDELLAGYWDHYHYAFADLRDAGQSDDEERKAWMNNHGRDPYEYTASREYINQLKKDKSRELAKFSSYMNCLKPDVRQSSKVIPFTGIKGGHLTRRLYLEMLYEGVPVCVRAEDRNMMAFSIENRLPFLDYRLADFCFGLKNSMKIRNGLGKWLLRESMKGILPEKVRMRKDKTGFNAPFDEWIRTGLLASFEQMISEKSFVNTEIYDQKSVIKKFNEHLNGQNHYMFFWQYLNLNLWYELNFK